MSDVLALKEAVASHLAPIDRTDSPKEVVENFLDALAKAGYCVVRQEDVLD